MTMEDIKEKVIDLLEDICGDDPTRIKDELDTCGDADIESIYFYEIIGVLEVELGSKVSDKMLKEVHRRVKSSFNEFCLLLFEMQGDD